MTTITPEMTPDSGASATPTGALVNQAPTGLDPDGLRSPSDERAADLLEPVAWLHTLHMEGGQTMDRLLHWDGIDEDEPQRTAFGLPGRDYSEEYRVTSEPLYAAAPTLAVLEDALRPFADCCEQISDDEDDEEWAKFRLLIKDYRRARAALHPTIPEEGHEG